MIRFRLCLAAVGLVALVPSAAWAAEGGAVTPDPQLQALSQMVQQCTGREAEALAQAYALKQQLAAAQKQIKDLQSGATESPANPAVPREP